MANITKYASHFILNFILGRQPTIVPSLFKVALSTIPLGNDGAGLVSGEPNDSNYSRVVIPNDRLNFSIANNKIIVIISENIFNESSISWGRLTHFAILDDIENIWFYGELQNSIDAEAETSIILPANFNMFSFDICGGSTTDMSITTIAANAILNHFLGRSPILSPPPIFYLGISSTIINTEGIGMTEPWAASEYSRVIIPNDKNSFTMANNLEVTTAQEFRFNTAQVAWYNQTHYFISDAPTGGNIWWSGLLSRSRNVEIATTLIIRPGALIWKLQDCNIATPTIAPNISALKTATTFWGGK